MNDKEEKRKKIRIEKLKAQLRRYYKEYNEALDNMSCGKMLGEYISSKATRAKVKYNEIIDELVELDPIADKYRL